MKNGKSLFFFILNSSFLILHFTGCTRSVLRTVPPRTSSPIQIDSNRSKITLLLQWFEAKSLAAERMSASGSLTAENEETSQHASFDLKAKRLSRTTSANNTTTKRYNSGFARRIDSLSIIVSGPFGITAARFLATPESYVFYNVLNGDVMK